MSKLSDTNYSEAYSKINSINISTYFRWLRRWGPPLPISNREVKPTSADGTGIPGEYVVANFQKAPILGAFLFSLTIFEPWVICVAIVGRPNVGKSTLFESVSLKSQDAIIHPVSGVTRDRKYGKVEWCGQEFNIIDTWRLCQ